MRPTGNYQILELGRLRYAINSVAYALLLCMADIWIETTLLGYGDIAQHLFAPEPYELEARLLLFIVLVGIGLYIGELQGRVGRGRHAYEILTREHAQRTVELEGALRKIEQQHYFSELLLNSASDGIYGLDVEGRTTFINESGARMLGYRREELVGKHSHSQMHHSYPDGSCYPEEVCCMRAAVRDGETKHVSDEVLWREDGSCFPVEYTSTPIIENGHVTGAVVSFRDISERKRVEQDLRLAASAFETHEAIVITDTDGVVLRVNEAFTYITGYLPEEVVGHNSSLLSSGRQGRDFYRRMWKSLIETGIWEGEIWNRRKAGEVYPEWLSITAVTNEAGETTHYVGHFQDITERKRAASEIEHQAFYDALTNLPNRRFLYTQLEQALSRCQRHNHMGALLFLDLDHFKVINDSLGHQVGDGLVKEVACRVSAQIRTEDTAARLGGDEFVVLLTELSEDPEMALMETQLVVQKIQEALAKPFRIEGNELHVSSSIGIALFPEDADEADDILRQADIAMYKAKEQGRNTFQFYLPSMQLAASERLQMENDLRRALHSGELSLYYQPQMAGIGEVVGAECLLRWEHPEWGMVSPARFIHIAEDCGLILPIGEWVLRSACDQLRRWERAGRAEELRHLAINVSPKQFQQREFVVMVSRIVEESGVDPRRIELELTEGMLLHDIEEAVEKMVQLKALGISLAIDDFGTGYSSLAYLKRLPLDKLKIDQSFVRDFDSGEGAAIIAAIISMSHHLGLDVIAEGVECEEQFNFLEQSGCRQFQGYYFSPPLPVTSLERDLH